MGPEATQFARPGIKENRENEIVSCFIFRNQEISKSSERKVQNIDFNIQNREHQRRDNNINARIFQIIKFKAENDARRQFFKFKNENERKQSFQHPVSRIQTSRTAQIDQFKAKTNTNQESQHLGDNFNSRIWQDSRSKAKIENFREIFKFKEESKASHQVQLPDRFHISRSHQFTRLKAENELNQAFQHPEKQNHEFYIDSGASRHICSTSSLFQSIRECDQSITIANGSKVKADGIGNVQFHMKINSGEDFALIKLKDVLYFKNKDVSNLISISKLSEDGYNFKFDHNGCTIKKGNCYLDTISISSHGLYILTNVSFENPNPALNIKNDQEYCIHEWHRMLSHRNLEDIKRMKDSRIKIKSCMCSDICEACIRGKMIRQGFPKQASTTFQTLDIISSDVCGPLPVTSIQGYKYMLTFTDIHSNYTHIKFIKEKSEVPTRVKQFIEQVKVQFEKKPKIFRTDRGTEYMNQDLQNYLLNQGIKFQCTVGYAPEQNGVAERKNRTLVEAARTMLIDSQLPKYLWPEAINEACYNQNRVCSKSSNFQTPIEKYDPRIKCDYNDFHIFGSKVYFKIPDQHRRKLDEKARKGIYIGHDGQAKGYRIYIPESRQIVISRFVTFLDEHNKRVNPIKNLKIKDVNTNSSEDPFQHQEIRQKKEEHNQELRSIPIEQLYPSQDEQPIQNPVIPVARHQQNPDNLIQNQVNNRVQGNNQNQNPESDDEFHDAEDENIQNQDQVINNDSPNQVEMRIPENVNIPNPNIIQENTRPVRSTAGKAPSRFDDYHVYSASSDFEPKSYTEAIRCPDKDKWIHAMNQELEAINQSQAWDLVDLPESRTAVGSKWVFKRKQDQEGNTIQYKARLVAQGYSQKYGEDYDEVFAPVTRSSTFRLLLSVSGRRKLQVKQIDIKTAFLNGELQEEIYLKQPPGFKINNQVYKLKKSLYGLKQAARVWNKTIHQVLVNDNFVQSQADKCLYIKKFNSKECYLILHVDDILIAGSDKEIIDQTYFNLAKHFEVKDLGTIKYYLGISVSRDQDGNFYIDQESYIKKIAEEAGLQNAKPSKYPLDPGYYKLPESSALPEDNDYRKLIGKLLYVSTNSRPDISSSVCILSQKVSNPTVTDLLEVKRIIRYLVETKDLKLKLSTKNPDRTLEFYSDANWAEDRKDRKSNSGYIGFVYGGTITWSCKKQVCVSLSSTEAEYIALTDTTQEILWFKNLCQDFDIKVKYPILIKADNQSAIQMVINHKFSNSTKHIETKYHFIKDVKEQGTIEIQYCPAEINIADMLTKPLGATKLKQLRELAGVTTETTGVTSETAGVTSRLNLESRPVNLSQLTNTHIVNSNSSKRLLLRGGVGLQQ